MKKTFKMENLDCANCAAKMEEGIKKIEGVKNANVSFLLQKVVIEAETDDFGEILEKAEAVVKKVDRNCKIIK